MISGRWVFKKDLIQSLLAAFKKIKKKQLLKKLCLENLEHRWTPAITATDDFFNASTGQNSSLSVLTNDSPGGDVSVLSYTVISPAGPSLVQNSDGTFTFNGNTAGSYTFDYTVTGKQNKVTASDGAGGDNYGYSVAISGNTVVVGACGDDISSNSDQGSAYVYVYSGSGWVLQQKLTAMDGGSWDSFGYSVAIFGDTIVVGSNQDTVGSNSYQGSAYVFTRSGSVWSQQQKLVALDGSSSDYFGSSVSVSVDTAVVGAYGDDMGSVSDQGSAYVFVRSGGVWSQEQKLVAADGSSSDYFGSSVSVSVDTVVVGAYRDESYKGSAYVFVRSVGLWSQ